MGVDSALTQAKVGGVTVTTAQDVITTLKDIRDLLWAHRVQWVSVADRTLMSVAESDDPSEVKRSVLD